MVPCPRVLQVMVLKFKRVPCLKVLRLCSSIECQGWWFYSSIVRECYGLRYYSSIGGYERRLFWQSTPLEAAITSQATRYAVIEAQNRILLSCSIFLSWQRAVQANSCMSACCVQTLMNPQRLAYFRHPISIKDFRVLCRVFIMKIWIIPEAQAEICQVLFLGT
jgi:hypothetical protein